MVRVLHILSDIAHTSGVANVLLNYYRNINKEEVQFDFLIFIEDEKSYKDEIQSMGGRIYFIKKPKLKSVVIFKKKLECFFQTNASNYIAVQLHDLYLNSLVFPIAKKYGINNCIAHSHGTMYSDKKINAIRNFILYIPLKRNANIYFACSKLAAEFAYGKKSVEKSRVIIINNAIDSKKYIFNETIRKDIRQELGIQNRLVVGHIGQFTPVKNHEFLLDVFCEILKIKGDSVLLLVGKGMMMENIKQLAKEKNIIERVFFLGFRNDINRVLQAIDVFVMPSLREGLPLSAVEAQASGACCILSDTITKEVNICNAHFLSIEADPKQWAYTIIDNATPRTKTDFSKLIKENGFDISAESQRLMEFYCNLKLI